MSSLVDRDVLFPAEPQVRSLARALYETVAGLPIISPHGHTDPKWYALDEPFPDPTRLLIVPDHYIFRMLFSQGVALEDLGVPLLDGSPVETDGRRIWRLFAENYHLFRGTPSRLWMDYVLSTLFGIEEPLSAVTADRSYDRIAERLAQPAFRPRALYERFNIEVIATTEGALDDLSWHRQIRESGWKGRVVTAYRPDAVVDPDFEGFLGNLDRLGEITGEDTGNWNGYLEAHRKRRAFFKSFGATSSDHGHPTAGTENLGASEAAALFDRVRTGKADAAERSRLRGQGWCCRSIRAPGATIRRT
jgi:glucuronate isomerase